MIYKKLLEEARSVREKAYAPYSNFKVGACVECEDGSIFSGCNIESASFGATNCAERVAIQIAVKEGHMKIKRVAVVGQIPDVYPCGICRQVIAEFATEDFELIIPDGDSYRVHTLEEILPFAFKGESLDV